MNAKDWIKELQLNPDWTTTEIDWEAVDEIEKKLKAVEIIKKKYVNLTIFRITAFMKKEGVDCYNIHFSSEEMHLTSEEFDLLKEVLK